MNSTKKIPASEVRRVKAYTSSNPWKCSSANCKNYANFKNEDGKQFYCGNCAKRVLRTNAYEAAAALLRWIDSERGIGRCTSQAAYSYPAELFDSY